MKKIQITLYGDPDIDIREGKQGDSDEITEHKKKYPFMARRKAFLQVIYGEDEYNIHNPVPYYYDGATIPFGLCKGDTRLLTPAMFHDIMTQKKEVIGYNRLLSSLVYFRLLRIYKVSLLWAFIQFLFVDLWQRTRPGWKRNK